MGIIKKLKTDKKFLVFTIGFVLLSFAIPYITIPALALWWFYKGSKFSKKTRILTTAVVGGLFTVITTMSVIAYSNDIEPRLIVTEPTSEMVVKGQQIAIKGTYEPSDRKVWVNGKEITVSDGSFETMYELKEGENKIDVSTGNWKRAHVYLAVTRELTDEEEASKATPTPSPSVAPSNKPNESVKNQDKQPPSPTPKTAKSAQTKEEIIEAKVRAEMKGQKGANGKDKIREIRVVKQFSDAGGYGVMVYINGSDNLSEDYIKKSIWKDMSQIYKVLYKENLDVATVTIFAHFDMSDKYGNTSDTMVLKTSLDKSEAEKVKWNSDEATLYLSILPNVWTTEKSLFK